jgi:proline dehydrogenase
VQRVLTRGILLRLANSPRVESFVKRNGMSAGFARRFIAGETMEETVEPVRALNRKGMTVSLDYLGENVHQAEEAKQSVDYYRRLFTFIADNRLDANVSLKLTQLGLDIDSELAYCNMRAILDVASAFDQFVRIDMEGSPHTQRTLDLFERLWRDYRNVGVVIQSYLYRSQADVERMIELGARIRLVKGAYNEPKEVAHPHKGDVDASFVELMKMLLSRGNYPAIATHDSAMIEATEKYAAESSIPATAYEFQMLYGIRRDLQEKLVQDGFRMRVYVPFGTQWYGYMIRRLAERPANLWFVLKNLVRR